MRLDWEKIIAVTVFAGLAILILIATGAHVGRSIAAAVACDHLTDRSEYATCVESIAAGKNYETLKKVEKE
tara:strand:- start:2127 stop:2339 length:213 start_codon:yes stop_codon:yes gene_type:complete